MIPGVFSEQRAPSMSCLAASAVRRWEVLPTPTRPLESRPGSNSPRRLPQPGRLPLFINGDPANDNSNGLDNVVLNPSGSTSVPEPGTLSPLGIGLLGLLRRRKIV